MRWTRCHVLSNFHNIYVSSLPLSPAIFMLAGVVAGRALSDITVTETMHVANLLIIYVVCHASRAIVIALASPALRRWGYQQTWKEMSIVWFGGLRGAVRRSLRKFTPPTLIFQR